MDEINIHIQVVISQLKEITAVKYADFSDHHKKRAN